MTPTFVLLHGLTFDRRLWEPLLAALPAGTPAVALDLPGHGAEPPLPERGLEPVADWLHGTLAAAGIEAPIVVGHSIPAPSPPSTRPRTRPLASSQSTPASTSNPSPPAFRRCAHSWPAPTSTQPGRCTKRACTWMPCPPSTETYSRPATTPHNR